MISSFTTLIEGFLFKYWWTVLFCLGCLMFYEQGKKKVSLEYDKLHLQLNSLQALKDEQLKIQEKLMLKVNSQSDPDFVELLLMKELGVVPEGYTKVFFSQEDES